MKTSLHSLVYGFTVATLLSCGANDNSDTSTPSADPAATTTKNAQVTHLNNFVDYEDKEVDLTCNGFVCSLSLKQIHETTVAIKDFTIVYADNSEEKLNEFNSEYGKNASKEVTFAVPDRLATAKSPIIAVRFKAKKKAAFAGGGKIEFKANYIPLSEDEVNVQKRLARVIDDLDKADGGVLVAEFLPLLDQEAAKIVSYHKYVGKTWAAWKVIRTCQNERLKTDLVKSLLSEIELVIALDSYKPFKEAMEKGDLAVLEKLDTVFTAIRDAAKEKDAAKKAELVANAKKLIAEGAPTDGNPGLPGIEILTDLITKVGSAQ